MNFRNLIINSTIEIDLNGQANGEVINGQQVSGVGGSLDYIEAASWSKGGLSIMALPSTTKNNKYKKYSHQEKLPNRFF